MITILEFQKFIETDLVYEQKIISIIDDLGRQINLTNLGQLHSNYGKTIKVENMEKYNEHIFFECEFLKTKFNHRGPVTCHAFRAFPNSKSFGLHTDPDDVIIRVIEGRKKIMVNNIMNELISNSEIFIPKNTPHEVKNEYDSLILSFGLENFYVKKI